MTCSGAVIEGNWVWLPSIGVPVAAWGFESPGNYTNGQTSSLLGVSVHCDPTGDPSNRQQTHGIQSGCE